MTRRAVTGSFAPPNNGGGPAGFNAGLTARGGRVVSVDPIYQFSREDIAARIEATHPVVLEQARRNAAEFV